jgi:RsmE family RNA methyltransferase
MVGVRSLHFVHTETGEKSYLTSHILEPESLQLEVIKSLEQVWEGLYPEIRVHRSFAYFVRNHLVKLAGSETTTRLIASPGAGVMDRAHMKQGGSAMVIAVGSEGGWSTQERGDFQTHGFDEVGLGARIVRVEVALTMLLGQAILFGSVGD